ncbi:MAG: hypothetical protein JWQ09_2053 [Segetibacter sp.]|nr:hypothetical protein [Segetibacter sp.]
MFHDAGIYITVFIGVMLLAIVFGFLQFSRKSIEKKVLMYYKLDLTQRKITTITSLAVEEESKYLNGNDYELIVLTDLDAFTVKNEKLPQHSFLIILNDVYSHSLKMALPRLVSEHISIIVFLPILISSNSNQYRQKAVQQLNDFIFSEEFKNIFSYAQPNSHLSATIQETYF